MSKPTKVLLYYDGYELKAREAWSSRLYHYLRCRLRARWRRLRGKQVETGFYVAFRALADGLVRIGCDVRVNDFAAARADPSYPVGLSGYPSILDHADLPNPAIFGPGDPGYPDAAGEWARQSKVRRIIQPSDWFVDYYRPYCGDKMMRCPVGIDIDRIEDASSAPKHIDVLIYDKIRWHRNERVPQVLDRLTAKLDMEGLNYSIVRYGNHTQQTYFAALRAARSMAFLCEHETQGLACEEALAMNIPVFAWEEGQLVDPLQQPFAKPGLVVSNVPYFDERCGRTFKILSMEGDFDVFWRALGTYRPRDYVAETLAPEVVTNIYLDA
jgi:hypothetical protein